MLYAILTIALCYSLFSWRRAYLHSKVYAYTLYRLKSDSNLTVQQTEAITDALDNPLKSHWISF